MYKTWNSNIKYRNDHQYKMTNLILCFLCFTCANSPPGTDQTGFKGYHHQMIKILGRFNPNIDQDHGKGYIPVLIFVVLFRHWKEKDHFGVKNINV